MSSAISNNASVNRDFFAIVIPPATCPRRSLARFPGSLNASQSAAIFLNRFQLVVVDVVTLILRESVKENHTVFAPQRDNKSVATRSPLPCSCDPLLDDMSAKISVHQTSFGTRNGIAQCCSSDLLLPRISREPTVLEYPHASY
ncbi:MAG: hypothetical protein WDN03_16670 [Rhizomicrobium sp.]